MTVELLGISLAPAPGADALTYPPRLVERGVSFGVPPSILIEHVFLLPNDDSIHDGLHAGNSARDRRRSLGFVRCLDPARQLDRAFADRPDVDAALAQDGIVAEGLEHALLEHRVEPVVSGKASRHPVAIHVVPAESRDLVAQSGRDSGD